MKAGEKRVEEWSVSGAGEAMQLAEKMVKVRELRGGPGRVCWPEVLQMESRYFRTASF